MTALARREVVRQQVVDMAQRYRRYGTPLIYLKLRQAEHREYAALCKRYWGQHLWARGYWVASSGNVTEEVWKEYIKNEAPPEPSDDFHVA